MLRGRTGVFVGAVSAMIVACASPPPLATPTGLMPDLRGTWQGTWGGSPLTLVILDQVEAQPVDGVSVGSWQLLGQDLPAVSGILTVRVRSEPTSTNVRGRIGTLYGRLALVLEPATVNGGWISLTQLEENRMAGTGTALMRWEPQGPVELIREPPGPRGKPAG